jgi:hypothetical protein
LNGLIAVVIAAIITAIFALWRSKLRTSHSV